MYDGDDIPEEGLLWTGAISGKNGSNDPKRRLSLLVISHVLLTVSVAVHLNPTACIALPMKNPDAAVAFLNSTH